MLAIWGSIASAAVAVPERAPERRGRRVHNRKLLWDQREQHAKCPFNTMIALPVREISTAALRRALVPSTDGRVETVNQRTSISGVNVHGEHRLNPLSHPIPTPPTPSKNRGDFSSCPIAATTMRAMTIPCYPLCLILHGQRSRYVNKPHPYFSPLPLPWNW
jgi:hypothetical protein